MKYVAIVGALVALLAVIFVAPILTIAYTLYTYLSVMWLNITTFGGLSVAIRSLKKY